VTVEQDGTPLARIDAWPLFSGPITQIVTWEKFVVFGWNDQVHIVNPITREVISFPCDGYFGHLYPIAEQLLIADASCLISIDRRGARLWKSVRLGIDGVTVDRVKNGIIIGQGEWDPPGSWRPFRLTLTNGAPAA
jgi:hypothetical protein